MANILICTTGGTIASAAKDPANATHYELGGIAGDDLIASVPGISELASLSTEQIFDVVSSDIDGEMLLHIARTVSQRLADDKIDGVVVTHGTDTMEETAFFLDLTAQASGKPVVFVGAMRPSTAISADGPRNLMQAVALAAHPDARGRGTMIVMNDRIHSGYYASKAHTTVPDAFHAAEQGSLGIFLDAVPKFYYSAALPAGKASFDLEKIDALPDVAIIYLYEGQDWRPVQAAIDGGAKGIVFAANGAGNVPKAIKDNLSLMAQKNIPLVLSSRTGDGFAIKDDGGSIAAGLLSPQKARILLQLGLANGLDANGIKALFAF